MMPSRNTNEKMITRPTLASRDIRDLHSLAAVFRVRGSEVDFNRYDPIEFKDFGRVRRNCELYRFLIPEPRSLNPEASIWQHATWHCALADSAWFPSRPPLLVYA